MRYAWNEDVSLAYQVFGEGPVDLLYVQGYCSHLDLAWESPYLARFLQGLGALSRVIATDRRGWGLSDRFSPDAVPPLETLTDDLLLVMDEAESSRAVVFGSWECGIPAMLLAATHPDRVAGLVLCDTFPTFIATEDIPTMPTLDRWGKIDVVVHDRWGRHFEDEVWGGPPSLRDPHEEEWFDRYERASVPPGGLIAEGRRLIELDARPCSRRSTRRHWSWASSAGPGCATPRSAASLRIDPGARLALVGDEGDPAEKGWWHWYGRGDAILREIGALLADVRQEAVVFDRILATVLFTDIVDATSKAVELGDSGWKELLARHHASLRGLLGEYRGTEVDTAGDGFFATFDGPARAVRCAQEAIEAMQIVRHGNPCGPPHR